MPGISGMYNFRDVGSLPVKGSRETRTGVLFRSEALSTLTAEGLADLAASPIGIIVDLRTSVEQQAAPDRLPDSRPFRIIDLPILAGSMAEMATGILGGSNGAALTPEQIAQAESALPSLDSLYISMLEAGASPFVEIARLIAASSDDSPTAVLLHCTAGKDRTGIATALMLDAVGAARDAVIDDYASSQDNLAGPWADGMLHSITSLGLPLTPELRLLATGTPASAMQAALGWVDEHFGGADAYLQSGGLTDTELAELQSRLIA